MIEKIENSSGLVEYRLNGAIHRTNGPAYYLDGVVWSWYLFGKWHRYYGPVSGYNEKDWYIHGNMVK